MEVFILVLIVIGFAVLIARAGDEERRKVDKERYEEFKNYKGSESYQAYQDKVRRKKENIVKATANYEKLEKDIGNKFKKICQETIYENRFALLAERKKFLTKDPYGKIIDMGWKSYAKVKGDKSTAIDYFWTNVLLPELENEFEKIDYPKRIFNSFGDEMEFYSCSEWGIYCFVTKKLNKLNPIGYSWEPFIIDWTVEEINKVCDEIQENTSLLGDTSSMDGVEYELYCKSVLEEAGWEVEDTPVSGDQGVDLIASIEDVRVCIQCKCFTKAVGNKAVQEVAAGMIHWKGTHAVVVAKSGFTKSAKTLAASNKVILTSDSELENLENLVL